MNNTSLKYILNKLKDEFTGEIYWNQGKGLWRFLNIDDLLNNLKLVKNYETIS